MIASWRISNQPLDSVFHYLFKMLRRSIQCWTAYLTKRFTKQVVEFWFVLEIRRLITLISSFFICTLVTRMHSSHQTFARELLSSTLPWHLQVCRISACKSYLKKSDLKSIRRETTSLSCKVSSVSSSETLKINCLLNSINLRATCSKITNWFILWKHYKKKLKKWPKKLQRPMIPWRKLMQ